MSTQRIEGFRDTLRRVVPLWLTDRGVFRVGFQLAYTVASQLDYGVQALLEGIRAGWPGSDRRSDSLLLIGQSRMRIQGETQTDQSFVGTCQTWLADLRQLGGDVGLATELRRWLAGTPTVCVISRTLPVSGQNPSGGARYTTCAADGTVTQTYAAWDWDSVSNPERNIGGPGSVGRFDMWIVVYPTSSSVYPWTSYVATVGTWGDGQFGPGSTRGIGLTVTQTEIDTIRGLIATWRGAHVTPRTLIWSYDLAAFLPATPARAGNPDGRWGRWFDVSTCLASRNRTHRYTSLGPERP